MTSNASFIALIILSSYLVAISDGQLLQNKEHKTHAASERINDLSCYMCSSLSDKKCANVTLNDTSLITKCQDNKRTCMVKQFSYTTSTENSTSGTMLWALERNCTQKCQPGCIIIGERTKLYACTTCCDKSLCNTGKGTANTLITKHVEFVLSLVLQILLTIILYPS